MICKWISLLNLLEIFCLYINIAIALTHLNSFNYIGQQKKIEMVSGHQ